MDFKEIEGDTATLCLSGVYKTCQLYEAGGRLFAAYGSGYVQLNASGTTSKPKLFITGVSTTRPLFSGAFGKLYVEAAPDRIPVDPHSLLRP